MICMVHAGQALRANPPRVAMIILIIATGTNQTKNAARMGGDYRLVAGIGFEPMTFGL